MRSIDTVLPYFFSRSTPSTHFEDYFEGSLVGKFVQHNSRYFATSPASCISDLFGHRMSSRGVAKTRRAKSSVTPRSTMYSNAHRMSLGPRSYIMAACTTPVPQFKSSPTFFMVVLVCLRGCHISTRRCPADRSSSVRALSNLAIAASEAALASPVGM